VIDAHIHFAQYPNVETEIKNGKYVIANVINYYYRSFLLNIIIGNRRTLDIYKSFYQYKDIAAIII